jgi:hypothetical protein
MTDNLQRYLPEFDEDEIRQKLSDLSAPDLIEMLIRAYKEKRVIAKMSDEALSKVDRARAILDEPSSLVNMPGIPGPDDLRRMTE